MSFVDPPSGLYSDSVPAIINAISYYTGLRYNDTRLYKINKNENCQISTPHYLNEPLNIGRTTQPSPIGGPLGNQNLLHISNTGIYIYIKTQNM